MKSLPAGDAVEGCRAPGVVAVVTHGHGVIFPPQRLVADLAAALDDGESKHVAGGQGRGRWRNRNRDLVLSGTRHLAWNGASRPYILVLMFHAACVVITQCVLGPLSDAEQKKGSGWPLGPPKKRIDDAGHRVKKKAPQPAGVAAGRLTPSPSRLKTPQVASGRDVRTEQTPG